MIPIFVKLNVYVHGFGRGGGGGGPTLETRVNISRAIAYLGVTDYDGLSATTIVFSEKQTAADAPELPICCTETPGQIDRLRDDAIQSLAGIFRTAWSAPF